MGSRAPAPAKRKTRRSGRVGGVLGAAHGAGAWCPAPAHALRRAVVLLVPTRYTVVQELGRCMVLRERYQLFSVEEGMGLPLLYHVALLMPSVSHGFSRLMLCSARYSSRGSAKMRCTVLSETPNFSAIARAVIGRLALIGF